MRYLQYFTPPQPHEGLRLEDAHGHGMIQHLRWGNIHTPSLSRSIRPCMAPRPGPAAYMQSQHWPVQAERPAWHPVAAIDTGSRAENWWLHISSCLQTVCRVPMPASARRTRQTKRWRSTRKGASRHMRLTPFTWLCLNLVLMHPCGDVGKGQRCALRTRPMGHGERLHSR